MPDSGVQGLDDLHRQAKTARSAFEPAWFLNLAFYVGQQWLAWDGNSLYRPQMRKDRVLLVDNRIKPVVLTEIARMTKTRPVFVATPTSGEEQDVGAAQMGERMMDHLWTRLDMLGRLRQALHWSRICGAGFWKVFWDSTAGESRDVLVDPNGEEVMPLDRIGGQDSMQAFAARGFDKKTVSQGEVAVDAKSPFQIYPDPLAEDLTNAEWVIEEAIQSRDYVRRRYDVDVEPDTDANLGLVESRLPVSLLPSQGGDYKGVKVREFWARPSSTYPQGKRCVWVKERLIVEESNPFDPLPYVMFSGIHVPGRFWPQATVDDLRGPQTELNKVKSQIAENRNRFGNPSLLKSRLSNVKYSGVPGEVVEYDDTTQNATPSFLVPPGMPGFVLQEIDRVEQSIREISGQHEVTSANVPPGVTAASAINLLQEADDTRLGPAVTSMEDTIAQAGRKLLRLVARFYTDQRTVSIAGDDGQLDVFDFKGAMLRDNTTVDVQAGSAFPRSKAAQQALMEHALQLFVQNGVPIKERMMQRFFRDMPTGGVEHLFAGVTQDEQQINRENRHLSQGQPVAINSYDNDQPHIDGHEEFQKTAKYQQLPDQAKQMFEAHVMAHRERFAESQAPMVAPPQPQGAPPNGPQQPNQ